MSAPSPLLDFQEFFVANHPPPLLAPLRRELPRLLLAVPSLCAGLAIVGALSQSLTLGPDQIVATYQDLGERCFEAQDWPKAQLCFERALRVSEHRPEYVLWLSQVADARGDAPRAQQLLDQVAPLKRPGHAPAQVWAARRLLAGENITALQVADAESHLVQALVAEPTSMKAHALLGQLLVTRGRSLAAIPHLERVRNMGPELNLVLASAYRAAGLEERAITEAERARDLLRERVHADPTDAQAHFQAAMASVLLKDFEGAVRVAEEGRARQDLAEYRMLLADIFVNWSQSLPAADPKTPLQRLSLLEQGLRHDPNNPRLLDALYKFMRQGGEAGDAGREMARSLLLEGDAAALGHFLLGTDALEDGRHAVARIHLERCLQAAPTFAAVANNLAWTYADGVAADRERGLKLADLAIQHMPQVRQFHGTKGRLLLRLGRPSEALPELEIALPAERARPNIHIDLAQTYEALGLEDLARDHRARADLALADVQKRALRRHAVGPETAGPDDGILARQVP